MQESQQPMPPTVSPLSSSAAPAGRSIGSPGDATPDAGVSMAAERRAGSAHGGQTVNAAAPFVGMYDHPSPNSRHSSSQLPYRAEMEHALGQDFSGVEVFYGQDSTLSGIDALAATDGKKILFKEHSPGKELVAHELIHIVQQRQTGQRGAIQANGGVSSTEDQAEQEAERFAPKVAAGARVQVTAAPSARLMRQEDPVVTAMKSLQELLAKYDEPIAGPKDLEAAKAQKLTALKDLATSLLAKVGGLTDPQLQQLAKKLGADQTSKLLTICAAAGVAGSALERLKDERVVQVALTMKDKLYWAGGSGPDPSHGYEINKKPQRPDDDDTTPPYDFRDSTNDLAAWVLGGPEPTNASRMNCWEAVLFSAYKAGVLTKSWILQVHQQATNAAVDWAKKSEKRGEDSDHQFYSGQLAYNDLLETKLGLASATLYDPAKKQVPGRGDVVFMQGLAHVALALGQDSAGNTEVMSLWLYPMSGSNFNSTFQKTTIEKICSESKIPQSTVSYGKSPW